MEDIKKNISIEFYEFQKNNKKNIYLLISLIILIIFIVLTKIINNYFESYIKANVIKSKCGADISEAETFRHIFLQHNKSDEELKFTFIIIVISLLIILFNERKKIIHFDTLFTDDSNYFKNGFLNLLPIILLVLLVIIYQFLKIYINNSTNTSNTSNYSSTNKIKNAIENQDVIEKVIDYYNNPVKTCLNESDNDVVILYSYIQNLLRENKIKYDTKQLQNIENTHITKQNAKEILTVFLNSNDESSSITDTEDPVLDQGLKNLSLILLQYIIIYIIILIILLSVYNKITDDKYYPVKYSIIFLIFSGTISLFTLIIMDIQSYIYQKYKKTTEIICKT